MSEGAQPVPIQILLVEDSPADVRLTREALKNGRLLNQLHVVENGVDAMAFLRRQGRFADAPRPDIILLDLNLPLMDGREVLAQIKKDPALHAIPVVILTTSTAEQDILKTYDLHANCYITKPLDLDAFISMMKALKQFWFSIVKLPHTLGP
jgi:two-component system, chemotaxis family, response regulator Rcp1